VKVGSTATDPWLGAEQQPAAVPSDDVDEPSALLSLALAVYHPAVDAALEAVLVVG